MCYTHFAYHFFTDLITLSKLGGTFCITYSVCQAKVKDSSKSLAQTDNDNNTRKLIMHYLLWKNFGN
jgi:hypothetical protein